MTRKTNRVGVVAVPKEAKQQEMLFEWMALVTVPTERGYRRLSELAFAVPNGTSIAGTPEQRARYMNALKRQGFKVGVSDVVLPYPVGAQHGLFIELKRDKRAAVSDEQVAWRDLMRSLGYRAEICIGWEAAREVILDYLGAIHRTVSRPSSGSLLV